MFDKKVKTNGGAAISSSTQKLLVQGMTLSSVTNRCRNIRASHLKYQNHLNHLSTARHRQQETNDRSSWLPPFPPSWIHSIYCDRTSCRLSVSIITTVLKTEARKDSEPHPKNNNLHILPSIAPSFEDVTRDSHKDPQR